MKMAITINANVERDFNIDEYGDFRFILEGEPLSDGSGNKICRRY